MWDLFHLILFYSDPPCPHLFLPIPIVHHAMLGSHGVGVVQRGSVKRHLGNLGDAVGDVGHAQTHCLVLVTPVLEELFEERRLTHLGQDLHLGVFGVTHILDELLCHLHGRLALVQVGVFALQERTSSSLSNSDGSLSLTDQSFLKMQEAYNGQAHKHHLAKNFRILVTTSDKNIYLFVFWKNVL